MADRIDLGGGASLSGGAAPAPISNDEVASSGILAEIMRNAEGTMAEPQRQVKLTDSRTRTREVTLDDDDLEHAPRKVEKKKSAATTDAGERDFSLSVAQKFLGENLEVMKGSKSVDPFLFTEGSDKVNFITDFEKGKDLLIVTGVKGDYVLDEVLGGTLLLTKDTDLAIYVADAKPADVKKALVGSLEREVSVDSLTGTDTDADSDSDGGSSTPVTPRKPALPDMLDGDERETGTGTDKPRLPGLTGGHDDHHGKDKDKGKDKDVVAGTPKMMKGTKEADVILGSSGRDVIMGMAGDDIILDDAGDDIILAGKGNDTLIVGPGKDFVFADEGNDTVYLNEGKGTRANGGRGDDAFIIGAGEFEITGGGGKDTYTIDADSSGKTRITDFRVGEDKMELNSKTVRLVEEANSVKLENNGQIIVELPGQKLTNELKDSIVFLSDASV